eukprot:NODE_1963_length_2323_cov_5.938525.p1 GENE.NODE_1963_length_2323_cov_5.938525~~NODE_1963_length_2323_cov_5.938525.p1  ORF type:complete len:549 (-),score=159.36 NODE_1963_length_2323_cov_5.938525:676-2166(-)
MPCSTELPREAVAAGSGCALHRADDLVAAASMAPSRPAAAPAERSGASSATVAAGDAGKVDVLGHSPLIPRWASLAFILAVVTMIMMFIVASVTNGIAVTVSATVDGSTRWRSPSIADLSLDNTLMSMYKAHAYPLLFIVVPFSVFWPYAKLLMMIYAWWVPMNVDRRGSLLMFLDQVGKLSMADNITLLTMVAFMYVSWSGEDITTAHGGSVHLALRCTPQTEVILFLAATMLSMVLCHVELAVHRIMQGDLSEDRTRGSVRMPLCSAVCDAWRVRRRRLVIVGGALLQVATLVLVIASFVAPMLRLDIGGVIGVFLDVTYQERAVNFSIITLLQRLVAESQSVFAGILAFYSVLLPVMAHVLLLCLWLVPLSYRWRLALTTISQTLVAWACLDIVIFSIAGTVLGGDAYGIGQFMEYVIYSGNVAPLCDALRDRSIYCITISLAFLPACTLVFFTGIVSTVLSQTLIRVMYKANKLTIATSPPCCVDEPGGTQP